jgi:NAD(P)-dependent dehydrogenase (short-subunit alcohol dehydrogenase family)
MPRSNGLIIDDMRAAALAGDLVLGEHQVKALRDLTGELLDAVGPAARAEATRYRSIIRSRRWPLPTTDLKKWLGGTRVLVTGGTGCIGTGLLQALTRYGAVCTSISRRPDHRPWGSVSGVTYLGCDIRNLNDLSAVVRQIGPGALYHTAAQRDPGLAEIEVTRTITTNVLGTRNIALVATTYNVPQVVAAYTGKALRFHAGEVYAASKMLAEWILTRCGQLNPGISIAGARFTYVGTNGIVARRIRQWIRDDIASQQQGGSGVAMKLHDPEIAFYVQSRWEAWQSLLMAGLNSRPGQPSFVAITNLDWMIELLLLALGEMSLAGSTTPIHFTGHVPGYEATSFRGLYNRNTAGEVSGLINRFEAVQSSRMPGYDWFDRVEGQYGQSDLALKLLRQLTMVCESDQSDQQQQVLYDLLWAVLDARLDVAPEAELALAAEDGRWLQANVPLSPHHLQQVSALDRAHQRRRCG